MESSKEFDKDIHIRLKSEHLREFEEVSKRLDINKSELVRLLVQLPTTLIRKESIRCIYIDQIAISNCRWELNKWGKNLNQAIRALNTIAYYIKNGAIPDAHYIERDIEDVRNAVNSCLDEITCVQSMFDEFYKHPYLAGRIRRSDVKRGRPRKNKELPCDFNEKRFTDSAIIS